MSEKKSRWQSVAQAGSQPGHDDGAEFPEPIDSFKFEASRRSFLKAVGFSFGATAFVACQRDPVSKAIPYLIEPQEIIPGRPYWMASVCGGCSAGCGVMIKCRDGRPIKLEGNPDHPISRGGLCAVGQASILELYDSQRLQQPLASHKASDWASVDRAITTRLAQIQQGSGRVRFLTGSIPSPSTRAAIDRFLSRFKDGRRIAYDALSTSAILDAHERTHGVRLLPRYRFDRASVIASFDADFLGTWISPAEFTRGYTSKRTLDAKPASMSWHAQFEPLMSLTGSKADERVRITPEEIAPALARLAALVAQRAGVAAPGGPALETREYDKVLETTAGRLWASRGSSMVVAGSNDVGVQLLVNYLNAVLGNYGSTVVIDQPSNQREANDPALAGLLEELRAGSVDALFIAGANPLYDLPNAGENAATIDRVPLVVSFAEREDESAVHAHFVCPDHHFLEAWRDSEPAAGIVSVMQPAIAPLGGTRALVESLAAWSGEPKAMYDVVRGYWEQDVYPRSAKDRSFSDFWDRTLNDGYAELPAGPTAPLFVRSGSFAALGMTNRGRTNGAYTLVLYPKVSMLDGRHAHNPWLHELPDPITKVTWDNYVTLSPKTANSMAVEQGQVLRVAVDGQSLDLPAFIQPGQHDAVIGVALGYGRKGTERFDEVGPKWLFRREVLKKGQPIGRNAAPLLGFDRGAGHPDDRPQLAYSRVGATITKSGGSYTLATTQRQNTLRMPPELAPEGGEVRPIVQETTLAAFLRDPASGAPEEHHEKAEMWEEHTYKGHRWGMAIDLTACTGCSGCIVSCQAENNIPVVGKDEVLRQREMHWIRVDRYYSGDGVDVDVVHQPMTCHHCTNAPCESVCPVVATVHSSEGLNQQVYNRCVGTRYCANNCPFKMRRFNWFDYPHEDRLQNMVLNPDVTVRSRGVMEKCSMCVQRIELGKIEAKRLGVPVADGAIQTACEQSCPAQAIVFGDLNDPASRIAKLRKSPRHYRLLEELNLDPAVGYMRVVRNRDADEEAAKLAATESIEEVHHV